MAAGRPVRSFYLALGVIAIAGVALIAGQVARRPATGSVAETLASVPLTPVASGGAVGHQLGSDSAPVEIAVFSDFSCPHCANFEILDFPLVRDRLIPTGRLRWRFVDFPLEGRANSPVAHLSAACAGEQGRFWEMMGAILNRQGEWVEDRRAERRLRGYAEGLGLDVTRFADCMDTGRAQAVVDAGAAEGRRLGVNATPTFFVNGRQWPDVLGYDQIRAIVDSLAPVGGAPRGAPAGAAGPSAPPRR